MSRRAISVTTSSCVGPTQKSRSWRSLRRSSSGPYLCQRPDAVHLLAHDRLDLAHHPQPERHPGVNAAGEPADKARANHQLVADELRVGGSFLERRKEIPGSAHSREAREDATFYLNSRASQPGRGSLLLIAGDL